MMWDAFQREVLGAMGHTLLVPVGSQAVEKIAAPASPRAVVADADFFDAKAQPALLRALALAAGIGNRDIGQSIALPPLAELRTPAGKRSLWPRLRALRNSPSA